MSKSNIYRIAETLKVVREHTDNDKFLMQHFLIIITVMLQDGCTQADLVLATGLPKSNISRNVNILHDRYGLVDLHTEERNRQSVKLSTKGRQLKQKLEAVA